MEIEIKTREKIEKDLKKFIEKNVKSIKEGNKSAIETHIYLNMLEKAIKEIKNQIQENVFNESSIEGKSFIYKDFNCSIIERKKYDFSQITEWQQNNTEIEKLKLLQKNIEKKYSTATIKNPVIDPTTGEEITSIPYLTTKVLNVK